MAKEDQDPFKKHFIDIIKSPFESMKHLTTLSSGALIFLTLRFRSQKSLLGVKARLRCVNSIER
jgi:hypothetical protein